MNRYHVLNTVREYSDVRISAHLKLDSLFELVFSEMFGQSSFGEAWFFFLLFFICSDPHKNVVLSCGIITIFGLVVLPVSKSKYHVGAVFWTVTQRTTTLYVYRVINDGCSLLSYDSLSICKEFPNFLNRRIVRNVGIYLPITQRYTPRRMQSSKDASFKYW